MDVTRWVRVDLSSISAEESKALLAEYAGEVTAATRHTHPNDRDDYVAIAQIAVLEAAVSYDPTRMSFRAWVAQIIRWRIKEFAQQMREQRQSLVLQSDGDDDTLEQYAESDHVFADPKPTAEDIVIEKSRKDAVVREFPFLEHRTQVLLAAEMTGESTAMTARSFGITKQRASQLRLESIECLRILVGVNDC